MDGDLDLHIVLRRSFPCTCPTRWQTSSLPHILPRLSSWLRFGRDYAGDDSSGVMSPGMQDLGEREDKTFGVCFVEQVVALANLGAAPAGRYLNLEDNASQK